ncbi:FAD-dependent oxidoreductase [uncultured Sphingomonas sp.]|uniref:FAD-dependent oxidoreductase n=1 Tax=uncultured Sphingomonas sp. TaxID=158754 RepID=UPI0035CB68D5
MTIRTRVLVVGAGPVGAVAAYRLAEMGIDTILLEAGADCPEDMRASTFHPPSLEMMETLGLVDELLADGLKAPVYQYRNRRSGHIVELDLGELADMTRHPYRLQCEQYKLARLCANRLRGHAHGAVGFNRRALSFAQDDEGVTVQVEGATAIETYQCDYLIAADGASSTIRKWTGVEFEGFTWPDRFLTLSTDYPIERHFDRLANVNYVADADEWCVLLRVPTLWRVLVPAPESDTDTAFLSDAYKDQVFGGLLGIDTPIETYHRTLYRVHQRVAKSFVAGRVLLVGDAAHLNNPLGGFGMNSGIHDAWNLTAKLQAILQDGAAAEPLLSRYDRQRRTICTEFVQAQTIQNKQAMEGAGDDGRSTQEHRMDELAGDPQKRRAYLMRQAMFTSLEREAEIA